MLGGLVVSFSLREKSLPSILGSRSRKIPEEPLRGRLQTGASIKLAIFVCQVRESALVNESNHDWVGLVALTC